MGNAPGGSDSSYLCLTNGEARAVYGPQRDCEPRSAAYNAHEPSSQGPSRAGTNGAVGIVGCLRVQLGRARWAWREPDVL